MHFPFNHWLLRVEQSNPCVRRSNILELRKLKTAPLILDQTYFSQGAKELMVLLCCCKHFRPRSNKLRAI